MDNFLEKLAEILEVDEVKPDDILRDFEAWDSLSVLSILAMLDSDYGVNLAATDLAGVKTGADLLALVESKRK